MWWAIVPIKDGQRAKSRLTHRRADERIALAQAFARDTLAAIAASDRIAGIVIVGGIGVVGGVGDAGGGLDEARDEALDTVLDTVLDRDGPRRSGPTLIRLGDPGDGLNAAVDLGRTAAPADAHVIAVVADLPALRTGELDAALDAAAEHRRSIVCDAAGIGTTALAVAPGVDLDPHFGPRSRAAHVATGAVDLLDLAIPGLRRDVDSEVDLHDARRLGVGPATAAVGQEIDLPVTCRTWAPGGETGQVVTDDGMVIPIAPDATLLGLRRIHPGQRLTATVARVPGADAGQSPWGPVTALRLPGTPSGSPG